jgi:3-deoxy-D-manno-octulosonic-acid transferase
MAGQMGIPVLMANARLSDRSYARRGWLRWVYRPTLRRVALVMAQSDEDARRLRELGAERAVAMGNTKFDQAVASIGAGQEDWRAELGLPEGAPVVVVGSTRSELEERLVATALADPRLADAAVVWAPRHVERAEAVAGALRSAGRDPVFRSRSGKGASVVLDTYGELARVYSAATVVVVGGGFDALGGQDIIQPMAHGKPVVHGPHMHNFRDVARLAAEAGAAVQCPPDAAGLADALASLLADPGRCAALGSAGRALVEAHLGAGQRIAAEVRGCLG